jgi:manganese transport protein
VAGEHGTYRLLILSQVILSMQLPFAVIPLIHFTSSRERMGRFANRKPVQVLAWMAAALILALNIWLIKMAIGDWLESAGPWRLWVELALIPILTGILFLLFWVLFQPILPNWIRRFGRAPIILPTEVATHLSTPIYRRILVPLDHTPRDRDAILHATAMAKQHNATLYLLHVEEGVTSQVYGPLSSTAEVEAGDQYFREIVSELENQQVQVEMVVRHSRDPKREIVRYAEELKPDLVVMGAHGHKGLKDLIFGTTINAVRHKLKAPLLVVRGGS